MCKRFILLFLLPVFLIWGVFLSGNPSQILSLFQVQEALAVDNLDDILVYRGGGDTSIPEYKTRDTGGFSSEGTAQDVTSVINFVRVEAHPSSSNNEKIMCTKDGAADINCQIFNGTSWGNLLEVSAASSGAAGFDVVYEQVSGDAMTCYRDNSISGTIPRCRIWNGSSWGAAFSANDVGGAINTIQLIPDHNSDYIAMMTKDGGNDVNIQIWNGSSWGNLLELDAAAGACSNCISYGGAWETSGDDFLAIWLDDATDSLEAIEFDKSTLYGSQINNVITGLGTSDQVYVKVKANPDASSDQILVTVASNGDDINSNLWSGSSFGTQQVVTTDLDSGGGNTLSGSNDVFGLQYEHASDYDAVITYGITAANLKYRVWDTGTLTWGSVTALPTFPENVDWHVLRSDPVTQNIMLSGLGTADDVATVEWDGSSFGGSWTSHETSSNDSSRNVDFAYDYENETVDLVSPTMTSWNLNMNAGTLTMNFDESVNASSLNVTGITVQDGATAVDAYTLTNSTTASGNGTSIFIDISTTDLNQIKLNQSLATAQGDSFLRITSGVINDLAGNPVNAIANGSAQQVTTYTADTTAPTLSSWNLNMNAATLTMTFSEPVDASTLDVTGITVQDGATAVDAYTLTNSTTASSDGTSIVIDLSTTDLNQIKLNQSLATAQGDSYVRITTVVIDDMVGNANTAIANGSAQQVTTYTADTTAPTLSSWNLNMNAATLTMTFSEPVDSSTLDVTGITVQDGATAVDAYTLTNSTTASSDGTSIVIDLSTTDLNQIKLNQSLATSSSDSFLRMTAATIDDMSGNDVTAIANGAAQQVNTYTADTTAPTLNSWDINLNTNTLTFTFSEPVDASTLAVTGIIVQDAATAVDAYTLTNSTTASSDGLTITIDLSGTDTSGIESNDSLATTLAESYLVITTAVIDDMAGNDVTAIANGAALQANTYTAGTTFEESGYRWFHSLNSTSVAHAYSALNTATTFSPGTNFRLRLLLHTGVSDLGVSGESFKLQYAVKSGTCDASFTGETYADVTTTSDIAYYDNSTPADGDALTINASDPTHSGHTIVNQTYEELNNFTNSIAGIEAGQDGKWDLSLVDFAENTGVSYCLRVVKSDGTPLSTYTVIPELSVDDPAYDQTAYRFYANTNSTDVGTGLAVQDTPATLSTNGQAFRMRLLLNVTNSHLKISGQDFKLQYAEKSGTCDTGFSGETYADVTAISSIAYNNNATPSDGDALTPNAADPTNGGGAMNNESYEEANPFTDNISDIHIGEDGKWDFALIDNDNSTPHTYCLRVVLDDGTPLDTYTVIPEISTVSGNSAPTGTINSASQKTNNTGLVDISIEVDDVDDDDTRAKLEYETDGDGNCGGPWAAATLIGPAAADFDDSGGAPDVNNANAYQIGSTATMRIITSSGSNTIEFDWDSDSDLPSANGNQCLRLTVNDDTTDQTSPDTFVVAVDNVHPTVTAARISVAATGTGTGGTFIVGDTVTVTWDNSASGNNNPDIASVTADLSDWGGSSTATMTDTTACGGTAGNNIYEACYTLIAGAIDVVNAEASVTATDDVGNITGPVNDGQQFSVDTIVPVVTAGNISVAATGTGTGGFFVIGDTVTVTWNNSAGGDNNTDLDTATADLSDWGGSSTATMTDTTACGGTASDDIYEACYTLATAGLSTATAEATVTATDNVGNETGPIADGQQFSVDTLFPVVTAGNISVAATGSGTAGTFIEGDTVTVTWDNSAAGDNNTDLDTATADLSDWGGSSTAAMTDTTACGGTASDDIYEACFTLIAGSIDIANAEATVTATDNVGNATGPIADGQQFSVDNEAPTVTAGNISVAATGTGTSGEFVIGDTVTVTWNNSAGGDNNDDIDSVIADLSDWGGSSTAAMTDTTACGGTASDDIYEACYTLATTGLTTATAEATVTATDDASNSTGPIADGQQFTVDTIVPVVTAGNISVAATGTGTGGAFVIGDTVTVTWDNSAGGDNNADLDTATADLSDWGGSSTATMTDTTACGGTASDDIYEACYTLATNGIETTLAEATVTATDDVGNETGPIADGQQFSVDTLFPVVTAGNISVAATGSGTAGTFIEGDTVTVTWDNSAGGDNNTDLDSATADLSDWGGSSTVAMTDTTACGGTAGNNIYEACYTLIAGAIDIANAEATVTAMDDVGNVTGPIADGQQFSVDNESPTVTAGNISVAATGTGTSGEFVIGDTVTVTWDSSAGGDNNADLDTATADLSDWGGSSTAAMTDTTACGGTASDDIYEACYTLATAGLSTATAEATVTATDDASNSTGPIADGQQFTVDTIVPVVTAGNISVAATGSGTSGTFIEGDTVTVTWDNSAGGDNNADLDSATADLSDWGGSSTAAMTDTTACGGTASDDIYEACFTLIAGSIDVANAEATVTATDNVGNETGPIADGQQFNVDNEAPTVTAGNISVANTGSGPGNEFVIGDTVTVTWDNSAGGDNNADLDTATADLSDWGGSSTAAMTDTTACGGTASDDIYEACYTLATAGLSTATAEATVTATDDASNSTGPIADGQQFTVDTNVPVVTAGNISVAATGTGTGGAFVIGDTVTVTWDNSAGGDNNTDLDTATADLSDWGGSSTAAMTDTTACGGTASDDIYEACFTLVSGSIDVANAEATVTATDNVGNETGPIADGQQFSVDNEAPAITDGNISVSGATGTGGAFIIGDTVTITWDSSAGGDNNTDLDSATADLSDWGGSGTAAMTDTTACGGTASDDVYEACFTLVSGAIDTTSAQTSVTAQDDASLQTGPVSDGDTFTVDTNPPNLTSWDIDLSADTITLTFDESVNASSLTVTGITIQDAATASTSYTLTNSTTASGNGTTIVIDLSGTDKNGLTSDDDLATSLSDSYIVITTAVINDVRGNDLVAINDGSALQASTYTAGTEYEVSSYRWFSNADSTNVGSSLAAQNTSFQLTVSGQQFRLRTLMHIHNSDLASSGETFKLQFAERSGTCDAGFVGETYADVTAISDIAFYNNTTPADGAALTANGSDPTHLGHTIVNQTYEELNNFTNSVAAIEAGQDGKWDFSLVDNGSPGGTSYCFRLVKSDGTPLETYTVIPEIQTGDVGFTQTNYRIFHGANSLEVDTPLAATNTPFTAAHNGEGIRLRILVHVEDQTLGISGQDFKMQYAVKSGTCDVSFTGETYLDMTSVSDIAYYDYSFPEDGDPMVASPADPTHGGDVIRPQTYVESSPFTNSVSVIDDSEDGKWDIVVVDNNGDLAESYCLRIVKNDGSLLSGYDNIPEFTTILGNTPPTVLFNSANQVTDDTGHVDVSVEVDDFNDDDVKLKIEYETDSDGGCGGPWANAAALGPVVADFNDSGGAPDVNNGNSFQIGSGATTRVITSSGSNTIQFQWDSRADLPNADGPQCLRISAQDDFGDVDVPDLVIVTVDNDAPNITTPNISVTGATGTGGAFKTGDTVTLTWDNSVGGDGNTDITSVTGDLSDWGGSGTATMTDTTACGGTASDDVYEACFTLIAGAIDITNAQASVTALDDVNNETTRVQSGSHTVDTQSPTVTNGNISVSGATGTAGTYIIGDLVVVTWDNSAGGDNNTDLDSATADLSDWGGSSTAAMTDTTTCGGTASDDVYEACYTLVAGAIDISNAQTSVLATDDAGLASGTIADDEQFNVDTDIPVFTNAEMFDVDEDGIIDRITFTLDQSVQDTASGSNGFDVSSASDHGNCTSESADPNGTTTVILNFGCTTISTEVGDLEVDFTANAGLVDDAGNQVATQTFTAISAVPIDDMAAPVVVSTSPTNGQTNVARTTSIVITFSEPMNTTFNETTQYTISPAIGSLTEVFSSGDRIVTISHAQFSASTTYTFNLVEGNIDAADGSPTGLVNTGPVTGDFTFTTASGGGGGGGGGGVVSAPTCPVISNASIHINGGAATTTSRQVTLVINQVNATEIRLSESPTFTGASYQTIGSGIPFTLSAGAGTKTIYAQFKNACLSSGTISDTIQYVIPATIEPEDEVITEADGTSTDVDTFQSLKNILGKVGSLDEIDDTFKAPQPSVQEPTQPVQIFANDLVRVINSSAVYHYGIDGKRHVFPHANVYFSWYSDFDKVKVIPQTQMSTLPLGKNVTYRPGTFLVKLHTDPKVYAIAYPNVLRWIETEEVAKSIYGSNWNTFVHDVSDAFFVDYQMGESLSDPRAYNIQEMRAKASQVDDLFGIFGIALEQISPFICETIRDDKIFSTFCEQRDVFTTELSW